MTQWTPSADRKPGPVPEGDPRWKALREPFPAHQIGHKPQPWCRACSDNKRERHCDRHVIKSCRVCRQRITEAHIDLDFVGHAAVTQRLLEVDPLWDWRPMTEQERKDGNFPPPGESGMWIWLTVLGKTRPGLGETEGGQLTGANAVKARMSDAIKNASMRFGVAIDTWSKEDLSGNAEADAEVRDEVNRDLGGDTVAPTTDAGDRDWAAEIRSTKTEAQLMNIAEQAKRAGLLKGDALKAAQGQKKKFDAAAKAAAAAETPVPADNTKGDDTK